MGSQDIYIRSQIPAQQGLTVKVRLGLGFLCVIDNIGVVDYLDFLLDSIP